MARQKRELVTTVSDGVVDVELLNRHNGSLITVGTEAIELAKELNYDGPLSVGALEDGIRFYQRRTVEACVELGVRLLILKEITPYGDFTQRIGLLGVSERTARRFMGLALKLSKVDSKSLAMAVGTQAKLLELVTLDDEEIGALAEGGSVRGLTLDDVSTMSVTELRSALREEREQRASQARLLQEKNEKLDQLETKLGKKKKVKPTIDAQTEAVLQQMREATNTVLATVYAELNTAFTDCAKAFPNEAPEGPMRLVMGGHLAEVNAKLRQLAELFGVQIKLPEDSLPEWMQAAQAAGEL